MKQLFYIIIFLLFSLASAQNKEAFVKVIVRENKDKIMLRWAVDKAFEWKKSNEYGFILEKYLFSENGDKLSAPRLLWTKNIKAEPLQNWEQIVNTDDNAAIIAQGLYGDSFLVEEGSAGKLADIVNLSDELDQRFSFSLLAADMSFSASVKAGWGYVDTEITKGNVYVYRVKTAVPADIAVIKSASVIADISKYEPLPSPTDLVGIWADKNVLLTWEYALFKTIYTTYNIEKSEDGVNFEKLSDTPLVNVNDTPEAPAKRMYYIDSLAQNDKKYYYRVYGISPFGEKGNYSQVISGTGTADLLHTPYIVNYEFTKNENEAIIEWDFPEEAEQTIEKFQLNQSPTDKGPYKIAVDNIPVHTRKITYSELEPSNYFTITAVGKAINQKKTSYSALIQPIDSIPPVPPIGLKGTIDSVGIVKISWTPNTEKDLLGYRIFKGNIENEEFSQITIEPISENYYTDSVKIASLNPKVYYRLVAVDKRFNNSEFSELLVVEKPNIIPPSSPVFQKYKVENGQVQLHWIPSPEENLRHVLLRKEEDNPQWQIIYQTKDTVSSFTDSQVLKDKTYVYRIKAINEQMLEASAPDLTINVINLKPEELIKEINSIVSREKNYIELFWAVDKKNEIEEYTIYKKDENSEPTTWKILPGNFSRVVDTYIHPGNKYTYYIRATLKNGAFSNTKTIEITY